jgi:hypothetical protein
MRYSKAVYLVESEHLSRHLPSILKRNFHAIIDLGCVSFEKLCRKGKKTYQVLLHFNVSQSVLCAILLSGQGFELTGSGTYHLPLAVGGSRHAGGGASEDDFE